MSPGDAQRHGLEAWGGVVWSGTCGALRGRGGVFDGGRWLCGTGWQMGMSGGFLGRWGLCMHTARAARGLWVMVDGGALAHARHGLGAACARGPGLGNARGWDSEWRWTVGCLPDKVGTASSSSSLLSTMG